MTTAGENLDRYQRLLIDVTEARDQLKAVIGEAHSATRDLKAATKEAHRLLPDALAKAALEAVERQTEALQVVAKEELGRAIEVLVADLRRRLGLP